MTDIYAEIRAEREHQQARWGNKADDTVNTPEDYIAFIAHHSTRWFPGTFRPHSTESVNAFRKQMIKVAALAVAAAESVDRQRQLDGKTFYES